MRNVRLAVAACLLALAAFACKKTRCMDPARDSEIEAQKTSVEALATLVEKNPQLCRELAAPRVVLEGDKLRLHGVERHDVGRRSDLPVDDIRAVGPLMERLQAYRTLWKTLYPTRGFPGAPEVVFDADVEIARALSVTHTIAAAGYPHQRVVVVDVAVTLDWWVPPLGDGPPPTHNILDVKLVEPGVSMLRMRKQGCVTTPWERAPSRDETIAKAISRLCNGEPHCPGTIEVRAPKEYRFRQAMLVVLDHVRAMALLKHDPSDDKIALLLAGSNPKILAPRPGAPAIDGAAHCVPDGRPTDSVDAPRAE